MNEVVNKDDQQQGEPQGKPDEQQGPVPGSDEYNQQMAAQYRGQADEADVGNKPDLLVIPPKPEGGHDKFYDAETGAYNWQGHAKELEFNAAGRKEGEGEPNTPEADPKVQIGENESASEIVRGTGLNVDDVANHIRENGTISDEHRAVLKDKAGLTDALIDGYIDGEKAKAALAQQTFDNAMEYAGGEEGWNGLNDWASKSLNDQQKEYVNGLLDSTEWKQGIDQIRQWQGATAPAQRGQMVQADGPSQGAVGYTNRGQMMTDMQKPEYQTDAAFRARVMAKVAVSKFEGDTSL